jgi:hypothetical protein
VLPTRVPLSPPVFLVPLLLRVLLVPISLVFLEAPERRLEPVTPLELPTVSFTAARDRLSPPVLRVVTRLPQAT